MSKNDSIENYRRNLIVAGKAPRTVKSYCRSVRQLMEHYSCDPAVLGEAINYALSQWTKLTVFVDHPQTRIDNNLTEQSIRPCKLGAKNWLFIGHPKAGHRSAVIYTLLESCKRNRVEPQAYFTDILKKLPAMTNPSSRRAYAG